MARTPRPAWVQQEYERIGREREQASREADRFYRWELLRVCVELMAWTAVSLVIAAFAFHVHDHEIGMMFLHGAMIVNLIGVTWTLSSAYRRGEKRGDW